MNAPSKASLKKKVLIIDDSPTSQLILAKSILKVAPYSEINYSCNLDHAIKILKRNRNLDKLGFDLIVIDMDMDDNISKNIKIYEICEASDNSNFVLISDLSYNELSKFFKDKVIDITRYIKKPIIFKRAIKIIEDVLLNKHNDGYDIHV